MNKFKWLLTGFLLTVTVGVLMGAKITEDSLKLCVPGTADTCTIIFDTNDGATNMELEVNSGSIEINNGPLTSSQITDSDIDLGTATDSSRMTVGKADSATLAGLARKEATVHYDTTQGSLVFDDGVDLRPVGSGAGSGEGGINTVENAGAEINNDKWTASGGASFLRNTGSANVGLGVGAFEIDFSAASETLDSDAIAMADYKILQNRLCTLNFYYKDGDANIKVGVHDGTNYISSEVTLETSSVYKGSGHITFICPSSGNIFARFESTADAAVMYFDQVFLGTTVPLYGAVVGDWKSYTPAVLMNISNTVNDAWYRRIGDEIHIRARFDVTGAATSVIEWAEADYLTPLGLTFDTTKAGVTGTHGLCRAQDGDAPSSANSFTAVLRTSSTGTVRCMPRMTAAATANGDDWDVDQPIVWANTDLIYFDFRVPVTEWAGTSLVFQPTADDLAIKPWVTCANTPVLSDWNNTAGLALGSVQECAWRRNGDTLEATLTATFTGTGTDTGNFTVKASAWDDNITFDCPVQKLVGGGHGNLNSGSRAALSYFCSTGLNILGTGTTSLFNASSLDGDNVGDVSANDITVFHYDIKIPIVEWADLGSIPAIGVEEAGDGVVGLAGPTGYIADPPGETCGTGCASCDMTAFNYARVGDMYFSSFNINVNNTLASRAVCTLDFSQFVPGLVWDTNGTNGNGTCHDRQTINQSGGTAALYTQSSEDVIFIVQAPQATGGRNYACVMVFNGSTN